jgi:uncharacterized protein (UPF0261 family)
MPSAASASAVLAPMPVPAPVISADLKGAESYSAEPMAVLFARGVLEARGYEVLVFHATGGDNVEVIEMDANVNDEAFATAMAERLDAMLR